MNLNLLFFVGIGGFLGAISRFLISMWVNNIFGGNFAYGTLAVNILGSFIIGLLIVYFEHNSSIALKSMLITGFLGALTTFSTFSLETTLMIEHSQYIKALLNIALNISLTIISTILALTIAKKFI